jgi:hypothetical protein
VAFRLFRTLKALAPLYYRHASLIDALALRALGSAAGEDIVQNVFVAMWRRASGTDIAEAIGRGTADLSRSIVLLIMRMGNRKRQYGP